MDRIKILNDGKTCIGLPKTPAKWVGNPKYTKVWLILLTFGGGMGGANRYEVVRRDETKEVKVGDVTLIEYNRENGKKVTLNPRYIVSIEDFTLVRATYDSRNPNFPMGKYTEEFLTKDDVKVQLVERFHDEDLFREG